MRRERVWLLRGSGVNSLLSAGPQPGRLELGGTGRCRIHNCRQFSEPVSRVLPVNFDHSIMATSVCAHSMLSMVGT